MELLYIENIVNKKQFEAEYYYLVINYLIGEKIHIHSNSGLFIHGIKDANQLTNLEYLDYHENYWIHEKREKEEELTTIFELKETYLKSFKYIKTLKSQKQIRKVDIDLINSQKELLDNVKLNVSSVYKSMLERWHLFQYIDLINDKIFKISFSLYNRKNVVLDEKIGELIYKSISAKGSLFVLGSMLDEQLKKLCDAEGSEEDEKNRVTLESILLFTIPCSPNLTKENLFILKKHFQPRFNILFLKIQEMRIEFMELQLGDLTIAKFIEFGRIIKNDIIEIQNDIDKHVYFQNIKNSDPDFKNINVYLGIIPPDMLLMIYTSLDLLTFDKMLELRHRIRTDKSKRKRDVEIYLKYVIDSEDNEL